LVYVDGIIAQSALFVKTHLGKSFKNIP